MDSVMDPELAVEMVKLLGQELKVVRSQLREVEQRSGTPSSDALSTGVYSHREEAILSEMVALKAENSSLQASISSLQVQITSVPTKMEDDHHVTVAQYEASMDAVQRELADAIREKNMANSEKEKANYQLEQLTNIREKYRNVKATKRECQEVIDELHNQLELLVEERKQFVSQGRPLESDPTSFFRNTDYPNVDGQPDCSDIPVYSNNLSMGIPKGARSRCCCDGTLRIEKDLLMFARAGIALGLILSPMYRYNPRKNGTWDRLPSHPDLGQKKDLCYYDGHGWKYLGTYERIGDPTLLSPENILKLDPSRLDAITKQTILFRDLVSPSQVRMVENMYQGGLLQIEMLGIRCVAYDQEFAKSLFENRKDLPRSVVKDATSMSKKRKRVETGEYHEGQQKKPSTSGTKVENAASTSDTQKRVVTGRKYEGNKKEPSESGGEDT